MSFLKPSTQMIVANITRLSVAFLAIGTALPLLPVGSWVVRLFDFPRLQMAGLTLLPLAGIVYWMRSASWNAEHLLLGLVCVGIVAWQLSHVMHLTPLWTKELQDANDRVPNQITSAVVNLQFENSQKQKVRSQLRQQDSDLLLLIEIDEPWAQALEDLEQHYPYREGIVRGEGLGIMLWSKLPFESSEVRYLVSDRRASIFATIRNRDDRTFRYVGVHPTPPGLEEQDDTGRHGSRIRDAELMLVAREVAQHDSDRWIVAGDFNDVGWSHTTRVFKRISGLKDPRVGRGLYNSYHAQYPLLRFPIDQVFLSPGAKIAKLERFHPTGSDHFAITTVFSFQDSEMLDPMPKKGDRQEARQMIDAGKQKADD